MGGVGYKALSAEEIRIIKEKIASKRSKRNALKKDFDRLDINPEVSKTVFQSANNDDLRKKEEALKAARSRISKLERDLSREINRKYKLENLLVELNSLNRKIEIGAVKCGECGSDKIIYKSGEFEFDLTNSYVKKSMISLVQ